MSADFLYEIARGPSSASQNSEMRIDHGESAAPTTMEAVDIVQRDSDAFTIDQTEGSDLRSTISRNESGLESTPPVPTLPDLTRFANALTPSAEQYYAEPSAQVERDPLAFYADIRLTPLKATHGLFHLLSSGVGMKSSRFAWEYSMVHTSSGVWSLVSLQRGFALRSPHIRPIATLERGSAGIKLSEYRILDLKRPYEAKQLSVGHLPDSWNSRGYRIGLRACKDYEYEWETVEFPPGTDNFEHYLWRTNAHSPHTVCPAARILTSSIMRSPFAELKGSQNWCLEIDKDRIDVHIALMTAFFLKLPLNGLLSWFAPRKAVIPEPVPYVNFTFEDDMSVIYQRSGKFYGDWEEEHAERAVESLQKPYVVRVVKTSFLLRFEISSRELRQLSEQAAIGLEYVRSALHL